MLQGVGRWLMMLLFCLTLPVWSIAQEDQVEDSKAESSEAPTSYSDPKMMGPEWFQLGWRTSGESELIDVFVLGQADSASAEQELLEQIRAAILEKLGFRNPDDPQVLPELSRRFIRERLLVPDRMRLQLYEDALTREAAEIEGKPPGPYYRGYAEARLTPELRQLVEQWKRLPALRDSLRWIGLGAAGMLGSLAILFGYLKADHLTRSHYSRRLQMLAMLAFAVLSGLIAWLA